MLIQDQDLVQGIIESISDPYSRKIIFSTSLKSKSAEEISLENDIPISTCYRRIHQLLEKHVLVVDRIILTDGGRKYETYRSAFRDPRINLESGKLVVEATPTRDPAHKLHGMWSSMRGESSSPIVNQQEAPKKERMQIALSLDPSSLDPVLKDCDLCQGRKVWCRTFTGGESRTKIYVCSKCESRKAILA